MRTTILNTTTRLGQAFHRFTSFMLTDPGTKAVEDDLVKALASLKASCAETHTMAVRQMAVVDQRVQQQDHGMRAHALAELQKIHPSLLTFLKRNPDLLNAV